MPYGLRQSEKVGEWGSTRSGRLLQTIKRDMDLKGKLMLARRRNEEILALDYDGATPGGSDRLKNLRENALNLPYRYARWLEAQMTSKRMVVKVNRDAGEGQRPGGPTDSKTGMWVGLTLCRVAYEAGFYREIKAVGGEVLPRGTSVMRIGYHEEAITLEQKQEVGKDAQSVIADVLGDGDVEAKAGQSHADLSAGLAAQASDPMVAATVGREGTLAILARKDSHDIAAMKAEQDRKPIANARPIRHKVWMRKLRVGEEVGWSPHVSDTEDSLIWWQRHMWTLAQVKASDLFTAEFKKTVKGYDGRNVSGVASGGQTPSTDSMGSDARQAQSEDVLEDDEKMVEWFEVWIRRPDMRSGGIRKIVCAECPNEFVESDDSNPHVFYDGHPDAGAPLIPGFFPFYDFTPILESRTIAERTCGTPPIAVGMPQFERLAEYNRLRHESALRHSLRLYDVHPAHKGNNKLLDALKNGEDGYAQVANQAQIGTDGKIQPSVVPIQFTGNTQEIEQQAAREEGDWIKVMAMPPAVLNGVGTAETAMQDQQGIAAGERESGAIVGYMEKRVADMLAGLRGLIRGCYDDEDFVALLGAEGAEVMKAWQNGTVDDGDLITVTFGERAQAQEAVERKQLMEAIALEEKMIDPITGLPIYDRAPFVEELHRRLDVGPPVMNASMLKQLQQTVMTLMAEVQRLTGGANAPPGGAPPPNGKANGKPNGAAPGGPRPAEGNGPRESTLNSGVQRGTVLETASP